MTGSPVTQPLPTPIIVTLGDSAVLVRFGATLTDAANRAAIALAVQLRAAHLPGVVEIVPNLVSVMLRYDPLATQVSTLIGELRLQLHGFDAASVVPGRDWSIAVHFDGPDLDSAAQALGMDTTAFVAAHNARPLRVLANGFAPGFVYCGLHPEQLVLPRRNDVRPMVPTGSVLFAAGQTAITATALPTGWHVIGRTAFINFDPDADPPTRLAPGDHLTFTVQS